LLRMQIVKAVAFSSPGRLAPASAPPPGGGRSAWGAGQRRQNRALLDQGQGKLPKKKVRAEVQGVALSWPTGHRWKRQFKGPAIEKGGRKAGARHSGGRVADEVAPASAGSPRAQLPAPGNGGSIRWAPNSFRIINRQTLIGQPSKKRAAAVRARRRLRHWAPPNRREGAGAGVGHQPTGESFAAL